MKTSENQPNPLIDTQSTQQWLAQLPLADTNKSIEEILFTLSHLQAEYDALSLDTIEQLHPTVCYLSNHFLENILTPFYLTARDKKKHFAKIIKLNQIMANLFANTHQHISPAHIQPKAKSLYYAAYHLCQLLLHSYQLYFPVPPQVWKQIHNCYAYASKNECLNLILEDLNTTQPIGKRVSDVIKSALLLGMSNPYQLHSQDTFSLYQNLQIWSFLLEFSTPQQNKSIHVFNINEDHPPIYKKLCENTELENENWIGLDSQYFVSHLKTLLNGESSEHLLPKPVIRLLIRNLSEFPTRSFSRVEKTGSVYASIGLSSTHYFLNGKKPIQPNLVQSSRDLELPKPSNTTSKAKLKNLKEEIGQAPSDDKTTYETVTWELVNESKNGFCICTTIDYPKSLHVGEIIGLQDTNQDKDNYWHIGIIRWVRHTELDETQIGIQIIAPMSIPIGLQNHNQRTLEHFLKGLLVPEQPALKETASIITPNLYYVSGDELQIIHLFIDSDIRLTNLVEETKSFKRFSFSIIQDYADALDEQIIDDEIK